MGRMVDWVDPPWRWWIELRREECAVRGSAQKRERLKKEVLEDEEKNVKPMSE
jgi:hypothetical protein